MKLEQQQQAQLATLISQNSLQVGPVLHPTPFSGRPTDDLLSFISHFEQFSTFCGWDDDQRLRAMPLYFKGNASSFFSSLSQMFESYQDLVKARKEQSSIHLALATAIICSKTSLHPNLRSHVILGQPKSLAEAENLARLCRSTPQMLPSKSLKFNFNQ